MVHFCPPGSGSGFRIRIRIHWSDWIRIQSGYRSEILISGDSQIHLVAEPNAWIRYRLPVFRILIESGFNQGSGSRWFPINDSNIEWMFSFEEVFRIHMFLGLPDPDPLVRGMDPAPDPDPSIITQKQQEKPWFPLSRDSPRLSILEKRCKCTPKK